MIYYDSSLLVRLYVREAGWKETAAAVGSTTEPIPLTFLHELEIINALYRGVFERIISPQQQAASLELFVRDLEGGLYRRITLDPSDLTRRALDIARDWTSKLGVRSLDLLHVAAAQSVGATQFSTGDERQRKLARAVGFRTVTT